ncbi:MAG: substrate-binding domain-containing protein [Patulibacter sp.]|nr:substrate-binding domain-containing protein [Patulibacter sp.]
MKTITDGSVRTLLRTALVVGAGALIVGCGGDDDNDGAPAAKAGDVAAQTTDAPAGSAGFDEVKQLSAELMERPTSIGVTEPVGQEIPSGKNLVWISCGVPACQTLGETFTEGAKELGWTVKVINTDGTPEKIKAAWTQVARDAPDAVASSGVDLSLIGAQLKQLKDADVPVALFAVPEKADGVTVLVGDAKGEAEAFGEPMAAFIVSDSGGKADTMLVSLPNFPILNDLEQGFKDVYEQGCADCGYERMDLPLSSLGKDVPARIVSALRAKPDVSYVAMAVDDLTAGLPAALRAAGLADRVKIVGATSGPTNYQYITADQQAAGVPNAFYEDTWLMVDGLARVFVGEDPSVSEITPPRMIVTKDNLPSTDAVFPLVEDYRAQFLKLWGKN